ncbi:MAG: methylenetetrahydrofolate reductase [NAD(P)H] [Syntrophales bacterium]|nr:methylenetetrahydrofolate reductase [NAD(P)H] [Syntrophales bacterium]
MKIRDGLAKRKFSLSFEVFPPVREGNVESLYKVIEELAVYNPHFISVTYGAGGKTRDKTIEIADRVQNTYKQTALTHLTCVNATKSDIAAILEELKEKGIENILALRGDPPEGMPRFIPMEGGFRYANELVEFIFSRGDFCIGVAGYPQKHPEAPSLQVDIENLKRKVDAGADFVITQLFFDNDEFYRFRDLAMKAGVGVPIIPGIFPLMNYKQFLRIIDLAKPAVPKKLGDKVERFKDKPEELEKYGVEFAVEQAIGLVEEDVIGIHIYTMNRSWPVKIIVDEGLKGVLPEENF